MYLSGTPDEPCRLYYPWVDFTTAILTAFGTMAALFERQKTGRGQQVEGSLLASALNTANGTIIEQAVLAGSPSNLSYGSWFWFGRQGYAPGPYTLTAEQNDKTLVRTVQLQPATSSRIVVGLPIGTSTRGASDLLRDVAPGTTLDIILVGFSPGTSVPPRRQRERRDFRRHPPSTTARRFLLQRCNPR